MTLMLGEDAAPEAVGALLMLLRMKGETAAEIAGFAAAAQAQIPALPEVDLDWPSYAAGRTRGLPWFLVSALMVAQSGKRVFLHGWNGTDPTVRQGLQCLGIPICSTPHEAAEALDRGNIAYMPLEHLCPSLMHLLSLRAVLGLRSCVNTVCRMLNPARATASVQGVFHPSYRLLQADAAQRLGWRSLSVIKGGGGEFERNPAKAIGAFGLRHGLPWQRLMPHRVDETRRLSAGAAGQIHSVKTAFSPSALPRFEREIILGTANLAMETLGCAEQRLHYPDGSPAPTALPLTA
jgi:anthranilate phosphoribosyltransferase